VGDLRPATPEGTEEFRIDNQLAFLPDSLLYAARELLSASSVIRFEDRD